jgi:lambda family phage portal protein
VRLFQPAPIELRSYEGAKHTRRTAGWTTPSTGPNAEVRTDLRTLQNRHRSLARDNPWAKRAIAAVVNNVIGHGIYAQWSNKSRQARWKAWFESTQCDHNGLTNGYGLQGQILRTVVESGECLVYRRRRFNDSLTVPLQLQVLEPDYLDQDKNGPVPGGGWVIQGVEFNAQDQRVGYWLFREHPGEEQRFWGNTSIFVPASEVLHLYRVDRPGQVRGVPWGAGAILILRLLNDYQDAQLERARQAACFTAFVRDQDPERPGPTDEKGYELGDILKPGLIETLPPGKDIQFPTRRPWKTTNTSGRSTSAPWPATTASPTRSSPGT